MTHRSVHAASHTARTAARVAPAGAASRCRRRRDSGCEAAGNETGREALLFLTLLIFFVDKRFAKSGSHRIASQVASPPPPVPSPHVSVSHSLRRDECFFAFALCSTDSASFVRPSRRIACARLASFFFSCLSMPRAIFTILSFISCISSVTLFDACLFSNADRGSRSRRAFRPRCTRCIVTAAACCFLFASRARIPRYRAWILLAAWPRESPRDRWHRPPHRPENQTAMVSIARETQSATTDARRHACAEPE